MKFCFKTSLSPDSALSLPEKILGVREETDRSITSQEVGLRLKPKYADPEVILLTTTWYYQT